MVFNLDRIFKRKDSLKDLIREELRVAGNLFFGNSDSRRFDFFYYGPVGENTHEWVFHDWQKQGKNWSAVTTRYLVQPDAVYRARDGQHYQPAPTVEVDRLHKAISQYYQKVKPALYD